ncbi:MFS transporter [Nocardia jinanensis]|uniref:Multidrug-efflux transporter n=1 Tax=Nocardia jinanensis TaxID=382504 RepID=A0A917RXF8_9NOCA|nr:MFS transporter [Nocardia jinanensis]GGL39830.1 putative multidrug-efflux transporter [Nocardia jinanensis]
MAGITNLVDGSTRIYLPLLAIAWEVGQAAVAWIFFAALLPWAVGSLFAGAMIDRADRFAILRVVNLTRAAGLGVAAMAAFLFPGQLAVLLGPAVVIGTVDMIGDICAQSMVTDLVEEPARTAAYGKMASVQTVFGVLAAPAIGGLLVAAPAWLALSTLGIASSFAVFLVQGRAAPGAGPAREHPFSSILTDTKVGLKTILHSSWLGRTAAAVGVMNLASSATMAVLVVYMSRSLGASATETGILLSAIGIGSSVGSLGAGRLSAYLGFRAAVMIGALGIASGLVSPVIGTSMIQLGIVSVLGGLLAPLFGVNVISMRQRMVTPDLAGRVNASFQLLGTGAAPLGALIAGTLSAVVADKAVFAASASLAITALVVCRPWSVGLRPRPATRYQDDRQEQEVPN